MKRYRKLMLVGLACVLGVSLAGCAGPDSGGDAAGGSPSAAPETSVSPETAPTPEEAAASDCLVGIWLSDNNFSFERLRQYGDEAQSVTGEVVITYGADGSLTTEYQEWLITFVNDGQTTLISRNGTDVGTFTATSDTLTLKDTQMGSKMVVTVEGMAMPVDPDPVFYEEVSYTCSSTKASITTPDGEMRMTRR